MPLLGAGLTGILWANLQFDALMGGIIWIVIGVIYMLFQTRFFKIKIADLNIDDAEKTSSL
jgi:putrescine importer